MQKRALTVNFQRAVGSAPVVMEVAVNPLKTPSAPALDVTLIGRQSQDVLLANETTSVVFELVPTDHPDLTERIPYRIAWREKYMGRQYTTDFVMPDFDVDFDDLTDLGSIIGGTTYVQWTDRSAPGGVAGLDSQGRVIDADGNVVSGAEPAAQVQGNLENEIIARLQGDNNVRTLVLSQLADNVSQIYASAAANLSAAVAQLQNADTTEKAQRQAAVSALNAALTNVQNAANAQLSEIDSAIDSLQTEVNAKADLVGGKVPSSQLPDVALGRAVPVDNEAAMLALTDVQPGDFAVQPDSIWFLNESPASDIDNWVQFQVSATVLSVNGETGAVVLSAADVGARSASSPVPLADVQGLSSALGLKTDATVTGAIENRLQNIENDTTYVHSVGGVIPRALYSTDLAYLNEDNQITTKGGIVINTGGGGGSLDIEDVTGLQAVLDTKVDDTDPALTNSRTPVAHKASHATGGSDALTPGDIGARATGVSIPTADITGLDPILTNNGLTSSSNHDGKISSLEGRVEDLELGGGGGGGTGASGKTVWFSDVGAIDPLNTATDAIQIRSPFGHNGTNYYYDPAGADAGEAVWPYISPNGHLKFVARNEANPADEPLATQDALDALDTLVGTKADDADLTTLAATVGTKAAAADLTALTTVVDGKASQTALNSTNDTLATKASQTALDTVSTAVAGKASQAALDSLTTTVGTKADASTVSTLSTLVGTKANLVSGTVPLSELPSLPTSKVTNLDSTLALKADLVTGKVPTAQIPDLATTKITNLDITLSNKADLVSGKVPTSQLPSLTLTTVVSVASRAAMLALTTGQVQPGDVAVITATADKGSYILAADDPSVFTNWTKLQAPDDAVQSVNGFTGTVVLTAADVGARSSATAIPIADITGLQTALDSKAATSALTSGLATKTSTADVQSLLSESVANKQKVNYAASSAVASLSGQQSVDGTLVPLGSIVLLTAQPSSVNNGIWQVNSGTWTRVSDMAGGTYFLKGSQAIVESGSSHANTVWLQTAASGVVGTNANNWTKVLTAGAPPVYTASAGVKKVGLDFQADPLSGGGIIVSGGKLATDPTIVPKKYAGDVPAGSTVTTITHNLNTLDVIAQFRDKSAGDAVLLGWKPTGVNTISAEFNVAPTSGQWRVVIV